MSYFYITEEEQEAQKQRMLKSFLNRDKQGDTLEAVKAMQPPCKHCGKYPYEEKEG